MKKNKNGDFNLNSLSSTEEISLRNSLLDLFKKCPIPENELLGNLPLFIKRQDLSRFLFMHDLYQKIIKIHGVVMEFGVRWGNNLALFENFRGMYEPFNHNRKIIGFDTFEGFPTIHDKDGSSGVVAIGSHSTTKNYEKYLDQLLTYHEKESPIAHLKKYELVKGDASVEIEKYLEKYPETIIALAYFDFDIYEPTIKCLKAIRGHLSKGSIIGFDELNLRAFPGETLAFKEELGINNYKILRTPNSSNQSYIVFE
ncbi:MAG: macrocin O-methyltransferase [Victivallaceae bacterium]|nr:macrocin O-methyltransferase [Victivallaceae bacterium]